MGQHPVVEVAVGRVPATGEVLTQHSLPVAVAVVLNNIPLLAAALMEETAAAAQS